MPYLARNINERNPNLDFGDILVYIIYRETNLYPSASNKILMDLIVKPTGAPYTSSSSRGVSDGGGSNRPLPHHLNELRIIRVTLVPNPLNHLMVFREKPHLH